MKNIKTILIMFMAAIIVASFTILTVMNYMSTEKTIRAELEKSITATTKTTANEVSLWLDLRKAEMETIANSPILASGDKQAIANYLATENKRLSVYSAFWVSDMSGTWYSPTGTSGSISERSYFKEILVSGKTVISDPLIGKADGKMACVVAVPIKVNGKMVGILGGNVKVDELVGRIAAIKIGQTGYAALNQADGLTIAHPNQEYIMKYNPVQDSNLDSQLKGIYQTQLMGDTGVAHYQTRGLDEIIAYTPIPGLHWTLSITATADEFMGPLKSLVTSSIVTALLILILAIVLVVILVRRMTKPLEILQQIAQNIAMGDLSVTEIKISAQNEFGRLARSFEQMVLNLRELIGQVTNVSEQVAASSAQLAAGAQQSAQAANQVSDTITNMAEETEQQLGAVSRASLAVGQMSEKINKIAVHTTGVVGEAEKTAQAAHSGGKSVEVVIKQMANIENTVISSAQVVEKLGERSKEIGQIVDTISGIAGQTNLLALNAAIEAARAGEQGRGFAVVAEEVRKLAEQSQQAAMQIAELISDIQQETAQAVAAMDNGTREVKVGSEVVLTTGDAFKEITKLIDGVSGQVKDISMVVDNMAQDSGKIVSSVNDIERLTKETVGETHIVSAATQEQSASMEEIASSSNNLSELAAQLQTALNKFKM